MDSSSSPTLPGLPDVSRVKGLLRSNWRCMSAGALGPLAAPVGLWNCPGTAGTVQKYGATCAIAAATAALVTIETGPGLVVTAPAACAAGVYAKWAKSQGGNWRMTGYVIESVGTTGTLTRASVKGLTERFGPAVIGKPIYVLDGLWIVTKQASKAVVRIVRKAPR